jgi:hypothetical protein
VDIGPRGAYVVEENLDRIVGKESNEKTAKKPYAGNEDCCNYMKGLSYEKDSSMDYLVV